MGTTALTTPGEAPTQPWLDVLALVTRRITEAPTFDAATAEMVELVSQAFGYERCSFFEVERETVLRRRHVAGMVPDHDDDAAWADERGLLVKALRTRRAVVVNDTLRDHDHEPRDPQTRAELVVPMLDDSVVVGLLDLESRESGVFGAAAVAVVTAVVSHAAVMRQLSVARARQEQRLSEQQAVHHASLEILAARPYEDTLREIAGRARGLCDAAGAVVAVVTSDGRHLRAAAVDGIDLALFADDHRATPVTDTLIPIGDGVLGTVAARGEPVVLDDISTWEGRSTMFSGLPFHAAAAVPLRRGEQTVGAIVVVAVDPGRRFGEAEVRALELLAAPAGLAIANALQVAEHTADLEGIAQAARSVAHEIDPGQARHALCLAAMTVCRARAASLWEPGDDTLVVTGHVGAQPEEPRLRIDGSTAVARAFVGGEPVLATGPRRIDGSDPACPPAALLCQPVLRSGSSVGVLTVEWDETVDEIPARIGSVVAVLASDAALAIERADAVARLEALARVDGLTGISNRRSWDDELLHYAARARREGHAMCVAILDLDRFKAFNDTNGHPAGDVLLRAAAQAWSGQLRDGDLIARYGGEEFAVILPACTLDDAVAIVERLCHATPAEQTCSAGVAGWDGVESPDRLVARADAALYEAKIAGRARVVAARPGQNDEAAAPPATAAAAQWTRWTGVVPQLLRDRGLAAAYQPVVRLEDSTVVGYEALARPHGMLASDSVEGLFAAAQFRGQLRDLDWLCRRVAVEGAMALPSSVDLFINVSVGALVDPLHGVDQMTLLLRSAGRIPERVVLEITEREVVRDLERLAEVLAVYRQNGYRFAIDDVGEGHSTLEVLATACPEFVKVARGLVRAADERGPRSAIAAIVAFAATAGSSVIAEGIESGYEGEQMRGLGITLGQGFALGRPALLDADLSRTPSREWASA